MKTSRAKHAKAPDKRPCRPRYWSSGRLAFRKCRALVLSGYEPALAIEHWEATRKRNKGSYSREALMIKLKRYANHNRTT